LYRQQQRSAAKSKSKSKPEKDTADNSTVQAGDDAGSYNIDFLN
jgi:hypothetical protein